MLQGLSAVDQQRLQQQGVVIQGSIHGGQHLIQSSNNLIATNNGTVMSGNNSNFIVSSSPNNIQPMILNNSNLITHHHHHHNGNVLQNNSNGNLLTTTSGKVITNGSNILNGTNMMGQSNQLISPGGQTVMLPNGYVLQPQQFTTVDGQVVNVINHPDGNGSTQYVQQTQQRIILSPDSKRRAKKRKSSSGTPPTPNSLSPQQSPTIQQHSPTVMTTNQAGTMLQITPQYQQQSFQISPGVPGIALVQNKQQHHHHQQQQQPQQQQIIQLPNGQTIIQPLNIIGQQLLMPAGLMVAAPETTLLQIQNVAPCGSIITPQGMMIRAPSPQNKSFLSPNGHHGGQQFIVSNNGQISPLGQMYSTPMGIVVPHTNASAAATYVQQNTTIVQQQTTMMSNNQGGGGGSVSVDENGQVISAQCHQIQQQHQQRPQPSQQHQQQLSQPQQNHHQPQSRTVSPPDTTTHSPRSPERPSSQRSSGSDINMVRLGNLFVNQICLRDPSLSSQVQCVSSSEPDSVVSPMADSAHSPSSNDYERSNSSTFNSSEPNSFRSNVNIKQSF